MTGQVIAPLNRKHVVTSISIAAVAIIFIGILTYGLTLDQSKVPAANINKTANAFTVSWVQGNEFLPGANGENFSLENFKGRPVVLNFWASWCVACREEAVELEKFWQKHNKEVAVVGIAIQDDKESAKKFAGYFGKTYIIGLDEDGKAAIDYGVSGVPETFFIDRSGIIRHKEIGPVTVKSMDEQLAKIL
jgi:cytochrome c biogenesis protein CcmG/thiol:disulfide interchange protein DsbE